MEQPKKVLQLTFATAEVIGKAKACYVIQEIENVEME